MQVFEFGRRIDGTEESDFELLDNAAEWHARLKAHAITWGYRGRVWGCLGDIVVTTVWGWTAPALVVRGNRCGAFILAILKDDDIVVANVPEHLVGGQPRSDGRTRA